jgi:hypothetical protein
MKKFHKIAKKELSYREWGPRPPKNYGAIMPFKPKN